MIKTYSNRLLHILSTLFLVYLVACSPVNQPTPTPTVPPPPSNTPLPTPTNTKTPRPTRTPDVTVTAIYENLFSKVQMFYDEGLIPSTSGEYAIIQNFSSRFAQIGWLRRSPLDVYAENFVFNGNVRWSTAKDTSDVSGCGVVFGILEKEGNDDYYGVILDKSRIFFTMTRSGYYTEVGKTRGTGLLGFGNPAEAELTLLVYDKHAFVYVDDNFIGEYTLSEDRELYGKFGYGIISGTNHSYGTGCTINNPRLWKINP